MLINRTDLMSDALHFSAEQAINPYYYDTSVDTTKAAAEHAGIAAALKEAGITVTHVPSPTDSQDGVYTANWGLVRGNKVILARLPDVRKAEEAYAESVLISLGKEVIHVPKDLRYSGQGDALACGDLLFAGSGYRSDPDAHTFAAEQLGYQLVQLETVPDLDEHGLPITNAVSGWPDSFFYDIDLAVSIIRAPSDDKKGLIAYCPEALTVESQQKIRSLELIETVEVSLDEAKNGFACNLVSTGETVIMSAHAPLLKSALEAKGLKVITPEVSELAKGGGYIRCTTLTLD